MGRKKPRAEESLGKATREKSPTKEGCCSEEARAKVWTEATTQKIRLGIRAKGWRSFAATDFHVRPVSHELLNERAPYGVQFSAVAKPSHGYHGGVRIRGFIWLEDVVEKIARKHRVTLEEAEAIFRLPPRSGRPKREGISSCFSF